MRPCLFSITLVVLCSAGYYAGAACNNASCIPVDILLSTDSKCKFLEEQSAFAGWSEVADIGGDPEAYGMQIDVYFRSVECCIPYCNNGTPARAWDDTSDPMCPTQQYLHVWDKYWCPGIEGG